MDGFLKQSTADTVKIGPFLDATDGVTEETALSPAVEVSKAAGAFAAKNEGTTPTHDAEGYYDCDLDTTDTGTLGILKLKSHDSATHLPVWHDFLVVPAHVYDGLVAGSDNLQVDTVQIEGGDATDALDTAADTVTVTSMAANVLTASALAADAVDEIHDEVIDGTITSRQAQKAMLAFIAGLTAGGGTTTITFKAQDDSTNVITMTVDSDGDRSAVTFDFT